MAQGDTVTVALNDSPDGGPELCQTAIEWDIRTDWVARYTAAPWRRAGRAVVAGQSRSFMADVTRCRQR